MYLLVNIRKKAIPHTPTQAVPKDQRDKNRETVYATVHLNPRFFSSTIKIEKYVNTLEISKHNIHFQAMTSMKNIVLEKTRVTSAE